MARIDKRKSNELRKVSIKKNYTVNADGSCLIEWGNTKVLCTATLDQKVPPFLRNSQRGWLTAEYGMLPGSCPSRIQRESSKGKVTGRTQEIQRLIGRSLRAIVDFEKMGERTIWIDCDVLQADGGTRTASITGAFVALGLLVKKHLASGVFKENILKDCVAAVSVGVVDSKVLLDLCYQEDSNADVDMNVVMTGSGDFIEIQGTAEKTPFSHEQLIKILQYAKTGITSLVKIQKEIVRI